MLSNAGPKLKKPKFPAGSPISPQLFQNLHDLYADELQSGLMPDGKRNRLHVFTSHGLTAFPLAAAVWEAVLNELFTSDLVQSFYSNHLFFEIADKWEVMRKTVEYPRILFGKTIDASDAVVGDLKSIIQIRNSVTHYKHSLYEGPDRPMRSLRQKQVTHPLPRGSGCPWHLELCSTESIRFCINTIAGMVERMMSIRTPFYRKNCLGFFPELYRGISDQQVRDTLIQNGASPESVQNDFFGQTE